MNKTASLLHKRPHNATDIFSNEEQDLTKRRKFNEWEQIDHLFETPGGSSS